MNPVSPGFYFWRKREGKVWTVIEICPERDGRQEVDFIGIDDSLFYFSELGGQLGSKIEVPET